MTDFTVTQSLVYLLWVKIFTILQLYCHGNIAPKSYNINKSDIANLQLKQMHKI